MFRHLLLSVHLLSVIAWLGGMFFAYFCLRPAAVAVLEPPQRLPLWAATFAKFLPYMAFAVTAILATGLYMFFQVGARSAPVGWHIMLTLGIAMAAVFAFVYLSLFPKLQSHCAAGAWPVAGQTLNRIRQLVGLNLALGVLVVVAAVSAR